MEDNTRYIMRKIWQRMFIPAFIGDISIFFIFNLGIFFLIARFCRAGNLVIYSAFLPFSLFFFTLECFFAIGAPQLFAFYKGAGRHDEAQKVFSETLTAYGTLAILGGALIFWKMPQIVAFLKIPDDLIPLAIRYGRLIFLIWFLDSCANLLRGFLVNDSLPKQATAIALFSATFYFLTCILTLGFLHCGVLAIPVAMALSECFSFAGYFWLILRRKATIRLKLKKMRFAVFKEITSLSLGNLITWATCFAGGTLFVRWALQCFGNAGVTLFALCGLAETACTAFEKSFITSTQSIVGMFRGEQNIDGIRLTCRHVFVRGLIMQIAVACFIALFAGSIIHIMPVQENFPGEAIWALRICMLGIAFRYAFHFLCGYYNVCGHLWLVSISSFIANAIGYFILGYFFFFAIGSERGIWFFFLVFHVLCIAVMVAAGYWQKNREHFPDMFLLMPQKTKIPTYHFLIRLDPMAFQDYREMLELFLYKQRISARLCHRTQLLFEELFLFAGEKTTKKDPFFCIETRILTPSSITISMRYSSEESGLDSILSGKQINLSPSQLAGAKILTKLADETYIDRIYGFNYIRLSLSKK